MSASASLTSTLQPGLSALTDFSTSLSRALFALDESTSDARQSLERVAQSADKTQRAVADHEQRLQQLEAQSLSLPLSQSQSHRPRSGFAASRPVSAKKLDLEVLKTSFEDKMVQAVAAAEETPRVLKEGVAFDPTGSQEDTVKFLVDRVSRLEQALKLQTTVNANLDRLATQDGVKLIYESLFKEIVSINQELLDSKTENENMKTTIKNLCESQNAQNQYMLDLLRSVGSKTKMGMLQEDLKEMVQQKHHLEGESDEIVPLGRLRAFSEANISDESKITRSSSGPIELKKNKSDLKGIVEESHDDNDSLGGADEEAPQRDNENVEAEGPEIIEQAPVKVVRKTVVNKVRKPTRVIHEQVVIEEEEEEVEAERTIVIRKKIRRPKPKIVEEYEDDDEEESTPVVHRTKHAESKEPSDAPPVVNATFQADTNLDDGEASIDEDGDNTLYGTESLAESQVQRQELDMFKDSIIDMVNEKANEQLVQLFEMKNQFRQRLEDLENSTVAFKRIAFVLDDLKVNVDTLKSRLEALIAGDSFDAKMSKNFLTKVQDAQDRWGKVYSEMSFALENINDAELSNTQGGEATGTAEDATEEQQDLWNDDNLDKFGAKAFFLRAREFSKILADKLEDIHPRDNVIQTLRKVVPHLLEIFDKGEVMMKMDTKARDITNLDYCFDDLMCSDLTPSLKNYVADALTSTLWILDEGISKYRLQQQIDSILEDLNKKADKVRLTELEKELRHLLNQKTDHGEFMQVSSRLASSAELQKLQSQFMDAHHHNAFGTGFGGRKDDHLTHVDLRSQPEYQELLERFETLTHKYVDIKDQCDKLVPKEEVHEALKAVVEEVKVMRRSFVSNTVFKESLKSKADTSQVEKIVNSVSQVLGDFNFADYINDPAAVHAKCLMCDKPVSARARSAKKETVMMSRTLPFGVEEAEMELKSKFPAVMSLSHSQPRLGSPNPVIGKNMRPKITSDVTISRSNIDVLPHINDSSVESPRGSTISHNQNLSLAVSSDPTQHLSNYKNRVRSSAGGGMGPHYKKDTSHGNTTFKLDFVK